MTSSFVHSAYIVSDFHAIHTSRWRAGVDGIKPKLLEKVAIRVCLSLCTSGCAFVSFVGPLIPPSNMFGGGAKKKKSGRLKHSNTACVYIVLQHPSVHFGTLLAPRQHALSSHDSSVLPTAAGPVAGGGTCTVRLQYINLVRHDNFDSPPLDVVLK